MPLIFYNDEKIHNLIDTIDSVLCLFILVY